MDFILSIDLGTSSLKAGIISSEGKLLNYKRAYFESSKRNSPQHWIEKLKEVIDCFSQKNPKKKPLLIDAIVISGHGPTLVPTNKDPLQSYEAISWDNEAKTKAKKNQKEFQSKIHLDFFLNKALFFKNNNPDAFKTLDFFLPPPEFLNYYLCDQPNVILPNSEYTPFYWDAESLKYLGLDSQLFPDFVSPGSRIGSLVETAAKKLNLSPGIPVIAGGPDFLMSLIGCGAVKKAILCDRMGTSEGLNIFMEKKLDSRSLLLFPHLIPGNYNLSGIISAAGGAIDWFLNITGLKRNDLFKMSKLFFNKNNMEKDLIKNNIIFVPHLIPPRTPLWKKELKGSLLNLEARHTREDLLQALLEGIIFLAKDIIDEMQTLTEIKEIRLSGGPAQNYHWQKLKASLFSMPLSLLEINDSELLGNALISRYAKIDDHIPEIEKAIHIKENISPDPLLKEYIHSKYEIYKKISSKLKT